MTYDIRAISLKIERETGCDSIATIERVYEQSASGAYCCPFPDCKHHQHDAEQMWKHVHLGKHRVGQVVMHRFTQLLRDERAEV